MEISELRSHIQGHLSDGLVIIVGSGLSCAEGMPGMGKLAEHIIEKAPSYPAIASYANWASIVSNIALKGLEAAFLAQQLPADVEAAIMRITIEYLLEFESEILEEILSGDRKLRFTRLLAHVLKPNAGIPVITTNYDRLIEIASEDAGLGVHSLFYGNYIGKLDPKESKLGLCRDVKMVTKNVRLVYREHICLFKPHGSFDWYLRGLQPVRYSGNLSIPRLMITPGLNKFRNGYDSPFDKHREEANKAIDRASRFLIIGYGFNDDHLETHLKPAIQSGKPTILLTQKISENAAAIIKNSSAFWALEQAPLNATRLLTQIEDIVFPNINLWDLNGFIDGAL